MDFRRSCVRLVLILATCALLVAGASVLVFAQGSSSVDQAISLELRGTDIRDALDALAKLTGTNIIADQSVQGTVTVTLTDVPFQKALDLIIRANGFNYRWVGNIVVVAKNDRLDEAIEVPQVETFVLKHAKADSVVKPLGLIVPPANVTVDAGTGSVVVKGTAAMLDAARKLLNTLDVEPSSPAAVAAAASAGEPGTRVYELKYAATEDVKAALALTGVSVAVGRKDRSLVVKGSESALKQADAIVAKLDVQVRQVVIETRIEEISATGSRKLGLDWTFPLTFVKDPLDVMTVKKVVTDFSATLTALEENGDATVLANPRIVAVDGKEANIHIGDRIPIVITKTTNEGTTTYTTQEVQFIDAGVILKVTPRFNDDETLTVFVNPEVSTITGQTAQGYPSIRTRSAETTMILKAGETVALGGLLSENEVDTLRKTPVLGDIPLLGRLFQFKQKERRQTEVIIFLTPRVGPAATAAPALAPVPTTMPTPATATATASSK